MKKLLKWLFSVKIKIIGSNLIVIFFMALVILFSLYQINQIQEKYERVINENVKHLLEVQQFQKRILEEIDLLKRYALTKDEKFVSEIEQHNSENKLTLESLVYKAKTDKEKSQLDTLKQLFNDFTKDEKEMINAIKQDKMHVFFTLMDKEFDKAVENEINKIVQEIKVEMNKEQAIMRDQISEMKQYVIYFNIFILVFGLIMALYIAFKIANLVQVLSKHVYKISQGDLTENIVQVKQRDEVGTLIQAFRHLQDRLEEMVMKIQLNAEQVASTSLEISASTEQTTKSIEQITMTMQEMATGSDEQVQHVKETAENVDQFKEGIKEIIYNANQASTAVIQTSETANQGFQIVEEAKSQMNKVGTTVDQSVQVINKLNDQSQKISEIIELITDIAEQTNLLALNAAIEAARAGEQGRGFAVVADEVRKLAEQSGKAAMTISGMIKEIRQETEIAVESMMSGNEEVKEGILIVDKVSEGFHQILSAINNVTVTSDSTLQAAKKMEKYVEQVILAMEALEKGIENNADYMQTVAAASEEQNASIEEVSSSIEALSHMAEELNDLVRQFKTRA